ncbi:hypothetical protein NC652_017453 [Populus alba x Populus x berolinensis]|nr:hypothetical protein NC652_017453 [Populus alba x Populus x berolinensis]
MSSVCISNCVNDTRDPRVPVRANYVNLYKWPEPDAELIKSVRRVAGRGLHDHPRVVDSISCRQMYLRSYTFSRKESMPEKTKKCLERVKEKVTSHGKKRKDHQVKGGRKGRCLVLREVKEISCGALFRVFHRGMNGGTVEEIMGRIFAYFVLMRIQATVYLRTSVLHDIPIVRTRSPTKKACWRAVIRDTKKSWPGKRWDKNNDNIHQTQHWLC